MTEKQKEKVDALLATAKKCEAGGIRCGLQDGMAYRLLIVRGQGLAACKTVADLHDALAAEDTTLYVSDGERLWREPRLVLELDVFSPEIVTRRYYFKGIKKVPLSSPVEGAGACNMLPEALPAFMDPAEVVIYDHTRQIKGRAVREVLT